MPDLAPLLSCSNVTVVLDGTPILHDVHLDLVTDEVHVLIGPNGAGKTTLANAITGHVPVTSGSVLLERRPLSGPPWKRARRGVGRKFQVPRVFPRLTVDQNLHLSRKQAGAAPVGPIGEPHTLAQELSHGSRQWLELSMVLSQGSTLVVLDEPTAGMPVEDRRRLAQVIRDRPEGTTFLIVEHDLDFVETIADRVSFMQDGRLVLTGRFVDVVADPLVRSAYLGTSVNQAQSADYLQDLPA